jgi:hypothetical protein
VILRRCCCRKLALRRGEQRLNSGAVSLVITDQVQVIDNLLVVVFLERRRAQIVQGIRVLSRIQISSIRGQNAVDAGRDSNDQCQWALEKSAPVCPADQEREDDCNDSESRDSEHSVRKQAPESQIGIRPMKTERVRLAGEAHPRAGGTPQTTRAASNAEE